MRETMNMVNVASSWLTVPSSYLHCTCPLLSTQRIKSTKRNGHNASDNWWEWGRHMERETSDRQMAGGKSEFIFSLIWL